MQTTTPTTDTTALVACGAGAYGRPSTPPMAAWLVLPTFAVTIKGRTANHDHRPPERDP